MFPNHAILILVINIVVAELLKNLFPESLMGTTIQDGGTRVRRDDTHMISHYNSNFKSQIRK